MRRTDTTRAGSAGAAHSALSNGNRHVNSFVRAAYKILTIHKQYTVNTFLISGYCVDMVSLAHISKMVPIQLKDYFSMIYLAPSISY